VKRTAILVSLAVSLALVGALAGQAQAATTTPAVLERLQPLDDGILREINAVRAEHGLRPVIISRDLDRAALSHSRSMLQAGYFAHETIDGLSFASRIKRFYASSGFAFWSAGENLLYNSATPSPAEAVEAWLASPPHRRNVLDPTWREVGIASLRAESAGGMYAGAAATVITMDFGVRRSTTILDAARVSKPSKPRAVAAHA
jgi:uncharacterized protein YkwD